MPKVKTRISVEQIEVDGIKVNEWTKCCAYCRKEYKTTSRSQKYCCEACCKKAQKKHLRQQKIYNANKEIARLASRSHSLGVEVLTQLERLGVRAKVCEICGTTEGLQVHHRNVNYLDNSPQNLQWLCNKCHSAEHSKISKTLCESGKQVQDLYSDEEWSIYSLTLKQ